MASHAVPAGMRGPEWDRHYNESMHPGREGGVVGGQVM